LIYFKYLLNCIAFFANSKLVSTMNRTIVFVTGLFLLTGIVRSQDKTTQEHTLVMNFLQVKDEMNYGLAFRGPGLGYAYTARWQNENRILEYQGRISFNFPMTRGIIATSSNIVPVKFDYLFKTGADGKVCVGPYAILEYNYETYPDLQSIYSFWFTNYSLGCALTGRFNIKHSRIDLSMHVTAFGLTSHQPEIDDPYFYETGFGDIIGYLHSDFQFGSWNLYNNYELELRWTPKPDARLAFAYTFQSYNYSDQPTLNMINQTVKLIFLPKKAK
jgi:hypothetical protein